MGYSLVPGDEMTIGCSDEASDFASDVCSEMESVILKAIVAQADEKINEYNTDGILNVAMFLNDVFFSCEYWQDECYGSDLKEKIRDEIIPALQKYIKESDKLSDEDWSGKENKEMHLSLYRNLLKRLEDNVDKYSETD